MGRADRLHRSSQFRTNPEEPGVVVPLELSPDVMVWYDAKTDIFTIEMNAKKNNNDRKYRYIIKDILPESRKALLKFLVLIERGMLKAGEPIEEQTTQCQHDGTACPGQSQQESPHAHSQGEPLSPGRLDEPAPNSSLPLHCQSAA
jgi:translation elongation factor EF-1alpha